MLPVGMNNMIVFVSLTPTLKTFVRFLNFFFLYHSKKAAMSREMRVKAAEVPQNSQQPSNTTASSSGNASTAAPPASDNRMDFCMETASLSPRVMAPVWDRRVITPRSGGEGGNRNRRQKLHQPLLMLLPSISLSSVLNV